MHVSDSWLTKSCFFFAWYVSVSNKRLTIRVTGEASIRYGIRRRSEWESGWWSSSRDHCVKGNPSFCLIHCGCPLQFPFLWLCCKCYVYSPPLLVPSAFHHPSLANNSCHYEPALLLGILMRWSDGSADRILITFWIRNHPGLGTLFCTSLYFSTLPIDSTPLYINQQLIWWTCLSVLSSTPCLLQCSQLGRC